MFYPLLDTAINCITERFTQLQIHSDIWSFLYNMQNISDNRATLQEQCNALSEILKVGDENDIDGKQLCNELLHLKSY